MNPIEKQRLLVRTSVFGSVVIVLVVIAVVFLLEFGLGRLFGVSILRGLPSDTFARWFGVDPEQHWNDPALWKLIEAKRSAEQAICSALICIVVIVLVMRLSYLLAIRRLRRRDCLRCRYPLAALGAFRVPLCPECGAPNFRAFPAPPRKPTPRWLHVLVFGRVF